MTTTPMAPTTAAVQVNGGRAELTGVPPHTTTLDWLREQGLTGAKEGCAEGECGACSILVARPGVDAATEWTAVNACLVPIAALDGQEIITAEGLGDSTHLHPVQEELAVRGGSQCGYCTPGFVCSMAAEYYRPGRGVSTSSTSTGVSTSSTSTGVSTSSTSTGVSTGSTSDSHEHGPNGFDLHALSGNLCRCTGYRPIRDAAYALATPDGEDALARRGALPAPAPQPTRVEQGGCSFVRPADLTEALTLLAEQPDSQLVAGSTDWGVEVNIRAARAARVVAIDRLDELRELERTDDEIRIGAALSLTEIERRLDGSVPLLAELFPQFASRLIRNGATIGGNLGTGSPIGDTPPALLALDARVVLTSLRGEREVPLADYFTGYRTSVKERDELIRAVVVPLPLARVSAFHKIAKRRFDDISSVAVGYAIDVVDGVVRRARIGLGGVAATPLRATATEGALIGRPWTETTVRTAAAVMATEGTPMDDHRASASYRSAMLGQSLLRLFAENSDHPEEVSA